MSEIDSHENWSSVIVMFFYSCFCIFSILILVAVFCFTYFHSQCLSLIDHCTATFEWDLTKLRRLAEHFSFHQRQLVALDDEDEDFPPLQTIDGTSVAGSFRMLMRKSLRRVSLTRDWTRDGSERNLNSATPPGTHRTSEHLRTEDTTAESGQSSAGECSKRAAGGALGVVPENLTSRYSKKPEVRKNGGNVLHGSAPEMSETLSKPKRRTRILCWRNTEERNEFELCEKVTDYKRRGNDARRSTCVCLVEISPSRRRSEILRDNEQQLGSDGGSEKPNSHLEKEREKDEPMANLGQRENVRRECVSFRAEVEKSLHAGLKTQVNVESIEGKTLERKM